MEEAQNDNDNIKGEEQREKIALRVRGTKKIVTMQIGKTPGRELVEEARQQRKHRKKRRDPDPR